MFLGTQILQKYKVVTEISDKTMQLFLKNSLAESQILHIRVLSTIFLQGSADRKDDIKISHCLPNWHEENKNIFKELDDAYTMPLDIGVSPKDCIDKRIAHATIKREGRFNWTLVIERMNSPLINAIQTLPNDGRFPSLMFLAFL
jgi:hypothetical protein